MTIWILFAAIAVVWGIIAHILVRNDLAALFAAAFGTGLVIQVILYWELGYPDPFLPITLLMSFLYAAGIRAVVEIPFKLNRDKREAEKHAPRFELVTHETPPPQQQQQQQ